jgi:hypothetical protein
MYTRRVSVALGLLLLGIGAPAMAQSQHPTATTDSGTIGLGLTALHENYGTGKGGEIDLQVAGFKADSRLGMGLVIDGSFNLFDGFTETTMMGGVRFALRSNARIRPFGQLLVGVEHCDACKTTDPTIEPAVGVDVALSRSGRLSVRGEAGYRVTPSDGRTFKETHVLVGISVRPGRR